MGGFSAAGALGPVRKKVINKPKPIHSHFVPTLAISASSFLTNIKDYLRRHFQTSS